MGLSHDIVVVPRGRVVFVLVRAGMQQAVGHTRGRESEYCHRDEKKHGGRDAGERQQDLPPSHGRSIFLRRRNGDGKHRLRQYAMVGHGLGRQSWRPLVCCTTDAGPRARCMTRAASRGVADLVVDHVLAVGAKVAGVGFGSVDPTPGVQHDEFAAAAGQSSTGVQWAAELVGGSRARETDPDVRSIARQPQVLRTPLVSPAQPWRRCPGSRRRPRGSSLAEGKIDASDDCDGCHRRGRTRRNKVPDFNTGTPVGADTALAASALFVGVPSAQLCRPFIV